MVLRNFIDWLVDKIGYLRTAWQIVRKEHEWRNTKSALIIEHNFYYLSQNSNKKDGPFCVPCTDTHHELIRMLQMPMAYVCPKCKLVLTNSGHHASWHIANLYRRNLFGEQEETTS
jgi:hypothetical protein